jgi:hypothetical protein
MNTSVFILAAILLAVYYSIVAVVSKILKQTAVFPKAVDIVGRRRQLWSTTRASIRHIFGGIDTLLEGYETVILFSFYFLQVNHTTRTFLTMPPAPQNDLVHCSYTSTLIYCMYASVTDESLESMHVMASPTLSTILMPARSSFCPSSTCRGSRLDPTPSCLLTECGRNVTHSSICPWVLNTRQRFISSST